ncbi:MAG: hypothetical protein VB144_15140 [Clostridia bacterium]|nr:hypothetical protein [Clostridia bacterium]
MDMILVAGGPGDTLGLARPAVEMVRRAYPAADVWVFVAPVSRATGREARVASSFPGVRRAVPPSEFVRYLATGIRPPGFAASGSGVVVHLGGGMTWAACLSRRLHYPLVTYCSKAIPPARSVALYLVEDERAQASLIASGAPAEKVRPVGNLTADSAALSVSRNEARARLGIGEDDRLVGLYPGLRPSEVSAMAPFLFRTAELLSRVERGVKFIMPLSPFVGTSSLERLFAIPRGKSRPERSSAVVEKNAGPIEAVTSEGIRVRIETSARQETTIASDLAICTPGPICTELAANGVAYVAVIPSNLPHAMTLGGLGGLLSSVPLIGDAIRSSAYKHAAASSKFFTIPNIKAGRMVTPEVAGEIGPEDVAIPSVGLLGDPARRDKIGRELREAVGGPGASGRFANQIHLITGPSSPASLAGPGQG